MRFIILLALLGCGCSPAPVQLITPTPIPTSRATPEASAEFTQIHEHFHSRMVPAFCELYKSGAHYLRADVPVAERQKVVPQLVTAFDEGIAELEKTEKFLAKLPPAPGALGRYVQATQGQVQAWKLEARVYRSFAQQTIQADASSSRMQKIVADLESTAQARLAATQKAQKAFDRAFGRNFKGLTRPANIQAF